jgi:biopolymer transport protein ExbD
MGMDEFAEINITPFTDVLLVLLIIFMLLATFVVPAGFERHVDSAGPSTATVMVPHSALVIARNGRMSLDGRLVDTRSVYPAMATLHASHRRIALSIFGDRETAYEYVIRAMDAAKAAGITDVSFVAM